MERQLCNDIFIALEPYLSQVTEQEKEVIVDKIIPLYFLTVRVDPTKVLRLLSQKDLTIVNEAFTCSSRYISRPESADYLSQRIKEEMWILEEYQDRLANSWSIILAKDDVELSLSILNFVCQFAEMFNCSSYDVMSIITDTYPCYSMLSKRVEFLLEMAAKFA